MVERNSYWRRPFVQSACVLACLLGPAFARADTRDTQFVAGLRQRRLFELAETYCQQRLSQPGIDDVSRADLTVELIRTHALHALHQPASERGNWFKRAHDLATEFARNRPPRAILAQVQDALTWIAEGELAAAEYRAGAIDAAELDRALQPLRQAAAALENIDKQLTRELPQVRRRTLQPGELTADELFTLQQHVLYQAARVGRLRGELYEPKSPDRIALLQQTQETLKTPLAQLAPGDPLANLVRLELAISERLLGNLQSANDFLSLLDKEPNPPEIRLAARAERIRAAIDSRDLNAAVQLHQQGRSLGTKTAAELDLAWLETYIAAWRQAQQASSGDVTAWQEKAAAMAKFIQQTHGTYWGRRADQLLVHALGGSAGGAGAAVLARTADNLCLKGELDQAVATYEKASEQAFTAGDVNTGYELVLKGAQVQQDRKLFADASRRLRAVSLREPNHSKAAPTHLQAAWNAAQEVRRNQAASAAYVELLNEHLKTFPGGNSAAQAALWLGQWQLAKDQPREAFAAFIQTPRDSPQLAEVVPAAANAVRLWFAELAAAGKSPSSELPAVLDFFQQVLFEGDTRLPERWTKAQRDAAVAVAELRLAYDSNAASEVEALLSAAIQSTNEAPAAWLQAAQLQRIIALAMLPGRERDAQAAIEQAAGAAPQQLLTSIERLSQIATTSPPSLRAAVARLQLQTITLLDSRRQQLQPAERVALDRGKAEAMLLAGQRQEGLALYAQLAKDNPDSGPIQEGYADALLAAGDKSSLQMALDQWRRIAARTKARTPRWFKAKYSVALAQYKLGDKKSAGQLLDYTLQTPPGLAGTGWQAKFAELLKLCSQ